MLLELTTRKPQALAQFPDLLVQEEAKSGSLSDGTTLNGAGAVGFGW